MESSLLPAGTAADSTTVADITVTQELDLPQETIETESTKEQPEATKLVTPAAVTETVEIANESAVTVEGQPGATKLVTQATVTETVEIANESVVTIEGQPGATIIEPIECLIEEPEIETANNNVAVEDPQMPTESIEDNSKVEKEQFVDIQSICDADVEESSIPEEDQEKFKVTTDDEDEVFSQGMFLYVSLLL